MQAAAAVAPVSDLRERVLAYLSAHTTMALATDGLAGLWAATILYTHEDLALYFTSVATTRHGQNMIASGRIAGTIHDECTEWIGMKGLQLSGTITLITEFEERRRIVAGYLARFPFSVGMWHGESNVDVIARDPGVHDFYRITPTKLYLTDNEYAPGRRLELALD